MRREERVGFCASWCPEPACPGRWGRVWRSLRGVWVALHACNAWNIEHRCRDITVSKLASALLGLMYMGHDVSVFIRVFYEASLASVEAQSIPWLLSSTRNNVTSSTHVVYVKPWFLLHPHWNYRIIYWLFLSLIMLYYFNNFMLFLFLYIENAFIDTCLNSRNGLVSIKGPTGLIM